MYLELGLEAGDDGGRDEPPDAAAVDAEHGDEPPLGRRWLRHLGGGVRAVAGHGE